MLHSRIISVVFVLVLSLVLVQDVSANWYAGNKESSGYGVKAVVYTPGSAPYTVTWQDNWVSTPATPSFVQTGWNYGPSVGYARPYVEHLVGGIYGRDWYGSQAWSTGVNYQVDCGTICSLSTWYAYINGSNKGGWGPVYAPLEMQALSEVHDSSDTVLNTWFSTVNYRDSSGVWHQFNQANWVENTPYKVQKDFLYYYRTYK